MSEPIRPNQFPTTQINLVDCLNNKGLEGCNCQLLMRFFGWILISNIFFCFLDSLGGVGGRTFSTSSSPLVTSLLATSRLTGEGAAGLGRGVRGPVLRLRGALRALAVVVICLLRDT